MSSTLHMTLELVVGLAVLRVNSCLRFFLEWHSEAARLAEPQCEWPLQPAQMAAIESPMGGGKAWPSLGDTRDPQKKARSLPAPPAKPAPLVLLSLHSL